MSLSFLADTLKIPDLITLKAIALSERRDGMIKIVDAISSTDPVYNLQSVNYRYLASSSLPELLPAIVEPDDGNGRYVMQFPPIHFGNAAPSEPPPLAGLIWVAFLTSPTRKVVWRSPLDLSTSSTVADWQPDKSPSSIDSVPSFNADFVGQKVKDTNTGHIYQAIDQTGDWILSLQDNGFVAGADITGDETLDLTYHGVLRSLTGNAIITLPLLTTNIETKLAVFDAIAGGTVTLTLSPGASTTLNGGTVDISINNKIVRVFNLGSNWFIE